MLLSSNLNYLHDCSHVNPKENVNCMNWVCYPYFTRVVFQSRRSAVCSMQLRVTLTHYFH